MNITMIGFATRLSIQMLYGSFRRTHLASDLGSLLNAFGLHMLV